MKKAALVSLLVVAVLLVSTASSFAWSRGGGRPGGFHHGGFHGRGVVVVGPRWGWGWGWGPYWGWGGWAGYYPPPYYYYPQPQVVVQPAPVYVEGSTSSYSTAEPAEGYWYYCPGSKAYYPNVPSCSEAWVKVPPRSE